MDATDNYIKKCKIVKFKKQESDTNFYSDNVAEIKNNLYVRFFSFYQ